MSNIFAFLNGLGCQVGCIVVFIIMLLISPFFAMCERWDKSVKSDHMEEYREYIAEGKYEEAHAYALDNDLDVTEVLSKQCYELLKAGKVAEANDLCARQDQMYVFFHTLTANLRAIYAANGIDAVVLGLALIPFPSPETTYFRDEFKQQWGVKDRTITSADDIASENNRAIEALCDYLSVQRKREEINQLLPYLQVIPQSLQNNEKEINRIHKKY